MPRTHRTFWPGIIAAVSPALMLALGLVISTLPGCASSPVSVAQDTEQRAYAVYGTFVIVEEQGAQVVASPGVAPQVQIAIRAADARAKPSADTLLQAVRDYDTAASAVKAGTSTADKLTIAATNLQKWVTQAQTDVTALVNAVKQGS